ncbi:MAG: DUF5126 domain-containing protein [Prevotellaceae bacterium]|jgi:hypothetical protein|nr:DUF5126 domain-containing protein [Prevotellaceae bacterium]
MKTTANTLFFASLLLLWSCADVETRKPFGENDGKAPGVVAFAGYTQTPGGAIVKFIAPPDEDLMYIRAKFVLDNGNPQESRASLYSDELSVEGFGNTEVKTLTFSAVDRYGNESEATTYDVVPGTPPCQVAYDSMSMTSTFGGAYVQTRNSNRKLLYIDVYTTDSVGEWYNAHTEYTAMSNIRFAVRGFANSLRRFRVVVRDMFDNSSQTYEAELTPLFEQQLDLTKFKAVILPTDLRMDAFGKIEDMFNGVNTWGERNFAHSADFLSFPQHFTFDMGVVANISRYVYWGRMNDYGATYIFDHGNMKTWEVWGSLNPDPNGGWNNWTKLMDCESIKPSGLPKGENTDEDMEYARKGEEFINPLDNVPVRYIRIKLLTTFSDQRLWHIQQLWFYGTVVNSE